MPDIDIDFCVERRQEVIDYVTEKYGKEKVVRRSLHLVRWQRAWLSAMSDACWIFRMRWWIRLQRAVPMELGITIQKGLEMNPELKKMYEMDEDIKKLLDMSMRLEGLPRHTSIHAAGVVISPEGSG